MHMYGGLNEYSTLLTSRWSPCIVTCICLASFLLFSIILFGRYSYCVVCVTVLYVFTFRDVCALYTCFYEVNRDLLLVLVIYVL